MQDLLDRVSDWWERKFFRIAAYVGFGIMAFFMFMIWTFPEHRVKQIASIQLEEAFDHEYDVSIEGMGFWRFTGIEMEGVRLNERSGPADGDEDAEMGRGLTVRLERISARFSPIRSLLNRGPTMRYQIDVGGSIIDGSVHQSGAEQVVKLSLNEVDLRESTLLASLIGLPLFGVLDGDVELVIDGQAGQLKSGFVDVTGRQLTLGSTVIQSDQIPVFTEFELPTTSFGNLELELSIEESERGSRVNFDRFHTRGRDLNTEIWGHIDLMPRGGQPRLEMRLQVNQEYVTEHDLGLVFNMSEFRDGEYQDWYGFVLAGTFDNLNFQGSTTAAQGPQVAGDEETAPEEESQ